MNTVGYTFFYLYFIFVFILPDSQESDGGANT